MIFLSCHDCRVSPHPQSLYFVLDSRDHFQVGAAVACMVGDEAMAHELAAEDPELIATLAADDRQLLAKACWETNRNFDAGRSMLARGFPSMAPSRITSIHRCTTRRSTAIRRW